MCEVRGKGTVKVTNRLGMGRDGVIKMVVVSP